MARVRGADRDDDDERDRDGEEQLEHDAMAARAAPARR
jgi:hypothetical protein